MRQIGEGIRDRRINADNYLIEVTLREYYELSGKILDNNEYQRRRVKSSSSIYSLLKEDLKKGCLMPPIVLALTKNLESKDIIDFIQEEQTHLLILDGLQRSFTIRDAVTELLAENPDSPSLQNKIRLEIYTGINKLGILYRMLTLNTGQTPMSTRHQIEIIYSDYIDTEIDGVKLLREIDEQTPKQIGEYRFRDVIEGFTSYIERDYLTLERSDILENVKNLEKLSTIDVSNSLFEDYLKTYNNFISTLIQKCPDWVYEDNYNSLKGRPFGNTIVSIFNKSQAMTGFGCAVGKLIDYDALSSFNYLQERLNCLSDESITNGLSTLIVKLDKVRLSAKKIGNDQRLMFYYFFKKLFDKDLDSYMDIEKSSNEAYKAYERETM